MDALRHLVAAEGYLCDVDPLRCPRHLTRAQRCTPAPVAVTEDAGIARQIGGAPDDRAVNETLLWQVLEFLDFNPHRWTQDMYLGDRGGVIRGCVAGWALVFGSDEHRFVIGNRHGSEIYRAAQLTLDLADWQAGALFGFIYVSDAGELRHPTFTELCERVREVCGVRYTPRQEVAA